MVIHKCKQFFLLVFQAITYNLNAQNQFDFDNQKIRQMKYYLAILLSVLDVCFERIHRRSDIFFRQGEWQTWIYNKHDKILTNDSRWPPYQITTEYDDYWSLHFNNTNLPPEREISKAQVHYKQNVSERIDTSSSFKFYLRVSLQNSPRDTYFINYLFLGYNEYDGKPKHYLDLVFWNSEVRAPEKIDRHVIVDNMEFYVCYLDSKHTKIFVFDTPKSYDSFFDLQPFQDFLLDTNRVRYNARLESIQYQLYLNNSGVLNFSTKVTKFHKECITMTDSRFLQGLTFVNDIKNMDLTKLDFSNMSIPLWGGNPQAHFQYRQLNPLRPNLYNAQQYAVIGYNRGKWVTKKGDYNLPIRVWDAKLIKFNFSYEEAQNQNYSERASRTSFMKIELDQNVNTKQQPKNRIYVCPFHSGPETKRGNKNGSFHVDGRRYTKQKEYLEEWDQYYFYAKDMTKEDVMEFDIRPFIDSIFELKKRELYLLAMQVGFQFYKGQSISTFKDIGFKIN